jgi:hypothetical protein
VFFPVFIKENQKFLFLYKSLCAETEEDAWKIGIGNSICDGILLGYSFTGDVVGESVEITPGKLGPYTIGVLDNV